MSIKQLENEIRRVTRPDKLRLLAFLQHELRTGTPGRQGALEQAHADIDAGASVTLQQLKRLSRAQNRIGL
jgi:hypothetical protein